MELRRWLFCAETSDEDGRIYLDEKGNEIDYSEALLFIGDDKTAKDEACRRADLWEEKNKGLLARITYESLGKM